MDDKEQKLKDFLEQIISISFGFIPEIKIITPSEMTIQIWFGGDQEQRRIIMGMGGKNINAIHRLATIFNRRQGFRDYLYTYVAPKDEPSKS